MTLTEYKGERAPLDIHYFQKKEPMTATQATSEIAPTPATGHPWMQSLLGTVMDLVHPTPEMIDFPTIATVLARVPRFAGHTLDGVYSVGQHTEQGALAILRDTGRKDWAAAFLLHDCHEAYIGDDVTPKILALAEIAGGGLSGDIIRHAYRELQRRLDVAIYAAAGVKWPMDFETSSVVKEYDLRMCLTERNARLRPAPQPWIDTIEMAKPVEGVDLYPWSEGTTRAMWWRALCDLCPNASQVGK